MSSMEEKKAAKAGFVTIIGKPNVGKSTLMNRLIGQKIAITSYKPQTTRTRIRTILTEERGQIVFLDTPGIHLTRTKLGEYMVKAAESTLKEVDLVLWLAEPGKKVTEEDKAVLARVMAAGTPFLLIINKSDSVKKAELLPVIAMWQETLKGAESLLKGILPVSARSGLGVDDLLQTMFDLLPEGEPYYDEEQVTTETERDITAEIIREKALRLLQEEVPHGIAVTVDSMKDRTRRDGMTICDIEASIICERESHKSIIIGKNGSMLKKIGTDARIDIEEMLQRKANLKLWVKVRRDWKDNDLQLKHFGYDRNQYR